jgi:hypothetical protein
MLWKIDRTDFYWSYHRLVLTTKRGEEKSRSDGHCECEKEMDDHLLACQQIIEIEPRIDTPF